MKIKTSELTGWQLDYAVGQFDPMCEGLRWVKRNGIIFGVDAGLLDDGKNDEACFIGELGIIERLRVRRHTGAEFYSPSTLWEQGGPISEREGISSIKQTPDRWVSEYSLGCARADHARSWGPTELVAKMRCYVFSCLGDEVDIPEELL